MSVAVTEKHPRCNGTNLYHSDGDRYTVANYRYIISYDVVSSGRDIYAQILMIPMYYFLLILAGLRWLWGELSWKWFIPIYFLYYLVSIFSDWFSRLILPPCRIAIANPDYKDLAHLWCFIFFGTPIAALGIYYLEKTIIDHQNDRSFDSI